ESDRLSAATLLFSESNSRFLCEVRPEDAAAFEKVMQDVACEKIGETTDTGKLQVVALPTGESGELVLAIDSPLDKLKEAWQAPLRW
ncbi:MAG: hypothetical protein N2C14_26350, partial [Planctomycetales bacterium]